MGMFCTKCGAQMDDKHKFCPNCGSGVVESEEQNDIFAVSDDPFEKSESKPVVSAVPTETPEFGPRYPMNWFKFLIYFSLFAGAVLNVVNGINYISGGVYFVQTQGAVTADQVYEYYGMALKVVDVIMGIACLGVAGLMIVTRFKLAGFKTEAPSYVYFMCGALIAVDLVYSVIGGAITATMGETIASLIPTFAVKVVLLICNIKYFDRRKTLFKN